MTIELTKDREGTIQRMDCDLGDDLHLHVRDKDATQAVIGHTVRQFGRALIMPNLSPPVTTVAQAAAYRSRILERIPKQYGSFANTTPLSFEPLMTLYLTEETSPQEIRNAALSGFIKAVKYYPAGGTTNSASGVTDLLKVYHLLEVMEETGLVFSIHGEVTGDTDVFDREKVFAMEKFLPMRYKFPKLRTIFEHATTKVVIDLVRELHREYPVAATLTAHHLYGNRNNMLADGINPNWYCKPIPKRLEDQFALILAAISGLPCFFFGSDSAPHARHTKENSCGCAGCYTANIALEMLAEVFDKMNALEKLEPFISHFGADFYKVKRNTGKVIFIRRPQTVPLELPYTSDPRFSGQNQKIAELLWHLAWIRGILPDPLNRRTLVPLLAGQQLEWTAWRPRD